MHLALEPLATIHSAVYMSVDTIATHQVAGPIAFVYIFIVVDELSIPARLITAPDSTVRRTIWPLHGALAVAHTP